MSSLGSLSFEQLKSALETIKGLAAVHDEGSPGWVALKVTVMILDAHIAHRLQTMGPGKLDCPLPEKLN